MASPSGTGHDGEGMPSEREWLEGAAPDPPVAVPGPASEPHEFVGRLDRWCEVCNKPDRDSIHIAAPGPASVSPAEPQTQRGFPAPVGLTERTLHADDTYIVVKLSRHERRLLSPARSGVQGRFYLLADTRDGSYELVRHSDGR